MTIFMFTLKETLIVLLKVFFRWSMRQTLRKNATKCSSVVNNKKYICCLFCRSEQCRPSAADTWQKYSWNGSSLGGLRYPGVPYDLLSLVNDDGDYQNLGRGRNQPGLEQRRNEVTSATKGLATLYQQFLRS